MAYLERRKQYMAHSTPASNLKETSPLLIQGATCIQYMLKNSRPLVECQIGEHTNTRAYYIMYINIERERERPLLESICPMFSGVGIEQRGCIKRSLTANACFCMSLLFVADCLHLARQAIQLSDPSHPAANTHTHTPSPPLPFADMVATAGA